VKKYNDKVSKALAEITGFLFFSQLIMEVAGVAVRKSGFEYTLHVCLGMFVASIIYSLIIILLNSGKLITSK